jgi:hypothetical protein
MEPTFIATLTANLLSNLAKTKFDGLAEKLSDRVIDAKIKHSELGVNPNNAIEKARIDCLHRLCSLQQDIVLSVSDDDFLKKTLPLSLDLVGNVYEADTEFEIEHLKMSIARLEDALKAYKVKKDSRKTIRLAAVIISLVSLILIGVSVYIARQYNIDETHVISILRLPVPVLLWSIIGSFAAILYRFTSAGDSELDEPLRWLFARPLTGIIMGAIAYLIMRVGFITVQGEQTVNLGGSEIMWLIAFLAGFSDRFSDYLLKNIVGRFGGSTDGDLLTLEMSKKVTQNEANNYPSLNFLEKKNDNNGDSGNASTKDSNKSINPKENTNGDARLPEKPAVKPETETITQTITEDKLKVVAANDKNESTN